MDLRFTSSWFAGHRVSWDKVFDELSPKMILEVGSYEGQSTAYMASRSCSVGITATKITCIDTWEGGREHGGIDMNEIEKNYDWNMNALSDFYKDKLQIRKIKGSSHDAIINLLAAGEGGIYDFAYIDGSHDASDVLFDALLAFKALRVGGIMCFDDFLWHAGDFNPLKTPRQGIESFVSCFRDKIFLFDSGQAKQCWLEKKASN